MYDNRVSYHHLLGEWSWDGVHVCVPGVKLDDLIMYHSFLSSWGIGSSIYRIMVSKISCYIRIE